MTRFLYTAWFRDTTADPDEQDYEWPAGILIEAADAEEALAWGDVLSKDF